jgi:uncharacterized membrane protein YcaP (DUF421 family)
MAIAAVLRAIFGYYFLILITRIVGRRPGAQFTPFEFVLVFYLGGLTLTGMVAADISLTNAICQIITIAICHYAITWARTKSQLFRKILDGSPMTLLERGEWRTQALRGMRVQDDDVMAAARVQGLRSLDQIDVAVLEQNGAISILKAEKK